MSLPTRADVVIIGGGVMGASAAFHLAEAGVTDVVVLEMDEFASGSTSKAAGGVRAQFSDPVNIALGARGLDAFENFHVRPGYEIDLHQVGYLFLLTSEEQVEVYAASAALQNSMGIATRIISREEAQALSPAAITDDVIAASYHPRDGYCSTENVVLGYIGGARKLGAKAFTHVTVTSIDIVDGVVRGVETSQGRIETATIVCTAGAWSSQIGAMAGVELPIVPMRRQILVSEPLPSELLDRFPDRQAFTIDAASTFYWHREGPGVLYGMSYQAETPGFKLTYSDEWLGDLGAAMERRCPELLEVGIAHQWAGLYEITPDHNALIGEASTVSRFIYAAGFSGHGFLQGPAIGEVLRDLYLRREPLIDVRPFTAERFATGSLRGEVNIV
jgi:sarcosine oxidase subunit beta